MILNRIMNAIKVLKEDTADSGWISAELSDKITASTSGDLSGIRYRKIGNHIYIEGRIICTYQESNITLNATALASEYRPTTNTSFFMQVNGTKIARGYVNTSGNIILEWIVNISDGSYYETQVSWLYFNVDYFVD